MAQSRLEKIGTIFTRVSGLLRSGAMKQEDKPIWYDVYAAFPPKLEPRFDRPAPNVPIRPIFYKEDVVRAKYHKSVNQQETVTLADTRRETATQQFIKIHSNLSAQGALDEEKIFETASDILYEQRQQRRLSGGDNEPETTGSLAESFEDAKARQQQKPEAAGAGINIQNIFKD